VSRRALPPLTRPAFVASSTRISLRQTIVPARPEIRGIALTRKENPMEYATLGNTGLLVSRLCFGTMTFGDGRGIFKAVGAVGQAEADELIKTSIDGGTN
jgi:hypothetical protein